MWHYKICCNTHYMDNKAKPEQINVSAKQSAITMQLEFIIFNYLRRKETCNN